MITVDETIEPGKYKLVLEGTEPPPPTGNCECDVQAGTTTTGAPGTQAKVTSRKVDKTTFLDFEIPQGEKGEKGDKGDSSGGSGGAGSISLGMGRTSVIDHGAKADSVSDDTAAFQKAWDSIRGTGGEIDVPPTDKFYRLNGTFNAIPDGSNQSWVDIKCRNMRAGKIRYFGPSNVPAIKIIGLKGGVWESIHLAAEDGRTGVALIDVSGTQGANSSSFVTFKNFYMNLGNGQNNVGIRTGKDFPGDISNYNFENITVFGGGKTDGSGAVSIPGQHAFQNLGVNTLSMQWFGGFVAFCDRAYANKAGSSRGNGSVGFFGLGGSQNNIDFEFAWEQAYKIVNGRWEGGNQFCVISDGGYSSVNIDTLVIHDYKRDNQIVANAACSLKLSQVQIAKTYGGLFNNCVQINANNRVGSLKIDQCAFSSNQPYQKTGSAQWDIQVKGSTKLDGVWSNGFFNNEEVRK